MNNESVGKKIVEALKKQAENFDISANTDQSLFAGETPVENDIFAEDSSIDEVKDSVADFFGSPLETTKDPFFEEVAPEASIIENVTDNFEMPANITVLKKLISQLPSGVSRHTGAQIIKQTMEALGISMKSVLQDAQQVQESLKVSAKECQGTIQEYKKQILSLEKQSQTYQKQYSALNDLISLFIQTTR